MTQGMSVAEPASRSNMMAANRKTRREFPENWVIIVASGLKFGRFEEAFLSSEDFLLIDHQCNTTFS
jgi:hypothetical protein